MKEIDLSTCLQLLKEEIVPALGCTEPGAVALAAACANEALGCSFEHMDIQVSGNMLKNVKSVSFVKSYFAEISVLENSLYEYKRVSNVRKNEKTIWDLLK